MGVEDNWRAVIYAAGRRIGAMSGVPHSPRWTLDESLAKYKEYENGKYLADFRSGYWRGIADILGVI